MGGVHRPTAADGLPAVEVTQMANLTSASKELEKLVLGRALRHDANPDHALVRQQRRR